MKKEGEGPGVYNEVISHSILRVDRAGWISTASKGFFFLQNYPVLFSGSVSTFTQSQLMIQQPSEPL